VLLDRRLKIAAMFGVCGLISVNAAGREVAITASRAGLIIGGATCAALMVAVGMLVLAGAWLVGTLIVGMMLAFAWQFMAECKQVAQLAVQELGVDDDEARG
jgi:hypothetical protein